MSLSDVISAVNAHHLSHPGVALRDHLLNAAAAFDDPLHRETALHHDTGKLSQEFQAYIKARAKDQDQPQDRGPGRSRKPPATTHALESALVYLAQKGMEITTPAFAAFLSILKHHGDLEDTAPFLYNKFGDADDLDDDPGELENRLESVCRRLGGHPVPDPEEACDLLGSDDLISTHDLQGLGTYFTIKEVFSRLIFSDKYEAIFKKTYVEEAAPDWEGFEAALVHEIKSKQNEMAGLRNQARQEILDQYRQNRDKSVFIIEAPTGIGKTWSALHLALTICRDRGKKRLVTALPMTSIIDQTHEEYANIMGTDTLLKYHHLTRAKTYVDRGLETDSETGDASTQQNDFIAMSWCGDNVIVTTFNQLLNLFYANRNRDLVKFWTLRDSVIILDEIQAIPRILIQDTARTLAFLARHLNVHFILMSATIPEITRFLPGGITAQLLDTRYFSLEFNNRYTLSLAPEIDEFDALVTAAESAFQKHGSLLCVVNTKKLSLELFSALEKGGAVCDPENELFLLNTNFIPKHRSDVIQKIRQRLKQGKRTLLVSTQVVEAGVDLDFNFGIREFAPLFSMVQTAGRVNRENREGLNQTARLLITETVGHCPYHAKDMLKPEVSELLSRDVPENRLLPLLKQYFGIAIDRTPPDPLLIPEMEQLNFESVFKAFSDHFMKEIPGIDQVFVEVEHGLHQHFHDRIDTLYLRIQAPDLSLQDKMALRSKLKNEFKEISQYTINVAEKETGDLQPFHKLLPIKVCPFKFVETKSKYAPAKGWLGEETLTLSI